MNSDSQPQNSTPAVPALENLSLSNSLSNEAPTDPPLPQSGAQVSEVSGGNASPQASAAMQGPAIQAASQISIQSDDLALHKISPRASDGILPTTLSGPIPTTAWWNAPKSQKAATIPLPKNFFELAAFKQANQSFDNNIADRYKKFESQAKKPSIYRPLSQPLDFQRVDHNNNFLLKRYLLPDLIDPHGFRKMVTDSYPSDSFDALLKLSKTMEIKRSLIAPMSQLESSLLWGVVIRITESFLVLANLVQIIFDKEAMQKITLKARKNDLRETFQFALNSIAQDIYSLEPILNCKKADRHSQRFQREVLTLFNMRIEQAPTTQQDQFQQDLGGRGRDIFRPKPLTYAQVQRSGNKRKISRPQKQRKRKHSSRGQRRSKKPRFRNSRDQSHRGPKTHSSNSFRENNIKNLNVRNTSSINTAIAKDKKN